MTQPTDPSREPGRPPPTRGPDGLDPVIGPGAPARPPAPDDDLAIVDGELARAEPGRLASAVGVVGSLVAVLCAAAGLTALTAAVLTVWGWSAHPVAILLAVVLIVVGVGLPAYIGIRARRLTDALGHPAEVIAQARDLVGRAKGSPELGRLAMGLRARGTRRRASTRGRIRRSIDAGRTASAVIGLAEPDPARHRHLIAFTPVRLRALWLAITIGLWTWAIAAVLACVSAVALLARTL